MKNNTKLALGVSLFVLIVFPLIFLSISIVTGNWKFFIFSIFPSFFAGFTGLLATFRQIKAE